MPETTIPRTLSGGYTPGHVERDDRSAGAREQVPDGRDADPAGVVDLHPPFGGVVIAVIEHAVPRWPAAGHHGRPCRRRDRRDDRPQRSGGGAGEIRVEVGHQPPLSHRVEHAPGRTVQAQDKQSIDGLRHGIVPNLPRTARVWARGMTELSGPPMACYADTRSRIAGWTAPAQVDREVRLVIAGDLPPLALGSIDHRRPPPKLLAERQDWLRSARASADTMLDEPLQPRRAVGRDRRLEPDAHHRMRESMVALIAGYVARIRRQDGAAGSSGSSASNRPGSRESES